MEHESRNKLKSTEEEIYTDKDEELSNQNQTCQKISKDFLPVPCL